VHLLRLYLHQYRNYEHIDIEPDPIFNIFWGENAQGKTNILEAISLLATLKSFRGAKNHELIREKQPCSRLSALIEQKGVKRRIDLSIEEKGKIPRLDGKEIRSAGDFFGCLNSVLFSPDEIGVPRGAPNARRALLDRALFQADVTFLDRVRNYERHLRQRNSLLRDERNQKLIDPWTEGLITTGALIRRDRSEYIERISQQFKDAYQVIAGGRERADIRYSEDGGDLEEIEMRFRAEIARLSPREQRLKQTLAGPHRDDASFFIDDRPVRAYASQGQQRSILLAFKTAQIMDLENRTGESPVLLLDDMTSELDRKRQEFFFNFLLARRGQVFITTTDVQPLMEQGFEKARFFQVKNGALCRDSVE
jgi:DNA replication and repair protein RecF